MLAALAVLDRKVDGAAHALEALPRRGPLPDQLGGLVSPDRSGGRRERPPGSAAGQGEGQREGDLGSSRAPARPLPAHLRSAFLAALAGPLDLQADVLVGGVELERLLPGSE